MKPSLAIFSGVLCLLLALVCACEDTRYASSLLDTDSSGDGDPDQGSAAITCDTVPDGDWADAGWAACGPVALSGQRYQSFARLVWMGERFAAVWLENQGRLRVAVAFIDPASLEVGEPIFLSEPTTPETADRAPERVEAVWTGQSLAVVWSTESGLWGRQVSSDGTLRGEPQLVVSGTGERINLKAVRALPGGRLGVVWLDDRVAPFEYTAWFASFGFGQEPVTSHRELGNPGEFIAIGGVSQGIADPCDCNDRRLFSLSYETWNRDEEGDTLVWVRFDQDGEVVVEDPIHVADNVQLHFEGESVVDLPEGVAVGLWDQDEGAMVVFADALGGTSSQSVLIPDGGGDRPSLANAPGVGWAGAVVDAVSLFEDGDGVVFFALDGRGQPLAGPLMLPGTLGADVDRYNIVAGGGGFGVLTEVEREVRFTFVAPR